MAYSNSWVNTTPASPIVVTVSPTAGDVLVAWFLTDNQNGSATLTLPTDFTQVGTAQVCTFDNQTLWVAIKNNATGSETSLSFNNSDSATMIAGVASFSGRDNTTPQDVTAVQVSINTGTTATPTASITPVTDGVDIIAINGADVNSSGQNPTFTFTTSAGTTGAWTTRQDQKNGFFNAGVGTAAQTTAGAITVTCTRSVSSGNSMTVLALRPSAGGGGATQHRWMFLGMGA